MRSPKRRGTNCRTERIRRSSPRCSNPLVNHVPGGRHGHAAIWFAVTQFLAIALSYAIVSALLSRSNDRIDGATGPPRELLTAGR